ncbi:MAG: UDP-N-acetylmuramoyl-L-alanine--D-glutamate ligase [Bacilli bacterium]|nr:UDP-N-acetylmuramoyl-L-alanine--D-glutamate ligase [Bacilli bacterium]
MYRKIVDLLRNKSIAILGFGKEGKSSYNFIRRHLGDVQITIIDKNDIASSLELLSDCNVKIIWGDDYLNHLDGYDIILKSPGISFKDIDITSFRDSIYSQIELILEVDRKNVIGITGTKGKSTTSSLIYNVFKEQGKDVFLLGNIGNPIFDDVDRFSDDTILVIEMSSHQLEFLKASPHVGIILNLYEDHLDHAGSIEHYHANKMNMFKYQSCDDIAIYSGDNDYLKKYIADGNYMACKYRVTSDIDSGDQNSIILKDNKGFYNDEILYDGNQKRILLGEHNLFNILFVMFVARLYNLDLDIASKSINSFKSLEHRLEEVGIFDGISYYNDTIATIPNATINGIKAIGNVDTLIFGGMDRGIDYTYLVDFLKTSSIKNLICMPDTGTKIGKIIEADDYNKNIVFVDTLDEAVEIASRVTEKGKSCLLSPAASSYNCFKNFEEKGKYYKEKIYSLYKKD